MYTIGDDGLGVIILKLHIGILQKVADAIYQWIIIHHVGKVGILDGQCI